MLSDLHCNCIVHALSMHYLSMESEPYSRWNTSMEITTANSYLPTDFGPMRMVTP